MSDNTNHQAEHRVIAQLRGSFRLPSDTIAQCDRYFLRRMTWQEFMNRTVPGSYDNEMIYPDRVDGGHITYECCYINGADKILSLSAEVWVSFRRRNGKAIAVIAPVWPKQVKELHV